MTISKSYSPDTYRGNGSITRFPITFEYQDDQDLLRVSLKDEDTGAITVQTITTHYTVDGNNIEFVTAPASTKVVLIEYSSDLLQSLAFNEADAFPANDFETAIDKLSLTLASLIVSIESSLGADASQASIDGTIVGTPVATKFIKYDGTNWLYAAIWDIAALTVGAGTGVLTQTTSNTLTGRTITGTSNEITVTNGSGVSGNPTLSLPSSITLTGKTITNGTYSSPTLTTPVLGTPSSGTLSSCTGLPEDGLSLTDITTNDASSTKHGFCPKLSNSATQFLRGTGVFSTIDPALIKISSSQASSSASISFTGLGTSTYRGYVVVLTGIVPATNNVDFYLTFSTNNGSSYLAGTAYTHASRVYGTSAPDTGGTGSTGDSKIILQNYNIYNGSTDGLTGILYIDPAYVDTSKRASTVFQCFYKDQGNTYYVYNFSGGFCNTSSATVNAIKFAMSSGNISSGTFTIYGVPA